MNSYKKIIILLAVASLVQIIFGHHGSLSVYLKVIFGGADMLALCYACFSIKKWDGDNITKNTLVVLLVYVGILLIIAFIHPKLAFTTYFFSPFYTFSLCLPVFVILSSSRNSLKPFFRASLLCLFIGVIVFRNVGYSFFFLALFYPYIKSNKVLFCITILAFVVDMLYAFDMLGYRDSPRSYIVELSLCILLVALIWMQRNTRLNRITQVALIICGTMIFYGYVSGRFSVFEVMSSNTNDKKLALDTRTFLYVEVFENMNSIADWLFGKGIDGGYYSHFFSGSKTGPLRGTVEVSVLQTLLHGGLVMLALHLSIWGRAVVKSMKYARNKFCRACGFLVTSFFFCSFMVDYPSRIAFVQILPWMCSGFCLSNRWLSRTDKEIETIFRTQVR